jgi:hypothetical protein
MAEHCRLLKGVSNHDIRHASDRITECTVHSISMNVRTFFMFWNDKDLVFKLNKIVIIEYYGG